MPDRIGRYRAERVLGSGAFATVWLAHDEALDAPVAIKVLAENWANDPDVRRRFTEEARILWQADSERIIRVHTVEELPDGRPYFVMDYADRGSLAQRMVDRAGRGSWSVDEAIDISLAIGEGLTVAHSLNIVHRDLKPSNILYQSARAHHGGDERLVLADFGIARSLASARGTTIATGTPHYMAPEQADGRADPRSDLYGAAVILYELLAGTVPFPYDSLSRVLSAQQSQTPTSLSARRGDVSPDLDAAIAQALKPSPDQRFSSATAWSAALRAATGRAPVAAPIVVATPPPSPPEPTAPMTMGPEEFAAAQSTPPPAAPPAAFAAAGAVPPAPPIPPAPPGPVPAGAAGGGGRRKKRSPWVPVAAVGALLAVLIGVAVVVSGGEDGDGGNEQLRATAELFLEPLSALGVDPFSDIEDLVPDDDILPRAGSRSGRVDPEDIEGSVVSISGDAPGLYGGTNQLSVCDAEQLVDFLEDNADEAAAFADVQGIDVDEIDDFVDGLTDVVLNGDVRVTNHGFNNGQATPRQSVLERGTAVLVDRFGVPRVKCKCGNPLLEPEPLDADPTVTGEPWEDFDPEAIIVIVVADDPIDEFQLLDLVDGGLLTREPGIDTDGDAQGSTTTEPESTTTTDGGGGGVDLVDGELVVHIEWFDSDDIDLSVVEPGGGLAGFGAGGTSPTGGEYTGDNVGNSSCGDPGPYEETITWTGSAEPGDYTVNINGYGIDCGDGSYRVTISSGGQSQEFTGSVTTGETDNINFTVG